MAARARIDPHMVARVLRAVRERHHVDAGAAADLLHALVDYLRLAMQRGLAQSEHELTRARLALQALEEQTGAAIDVAQAIPA